MSLEKRFFLETFGCQMNVVDSERIVDLLQGIGYGQVKDPEQADLILINTCSVRDKAERKVYGHLGRYKPLKVAKPALILGVGGCVAQQEGERLLEELSYVDIVFGTHNIHKLPEMVQKVEHGNDRCVETEFQDRETRLALFPNRSEQETVSRFVTVMQGCDNFCSYCVVPHVRGREISRPADEVVAEIRQLAAQGVREITLLGQNVNSYGAKDGEEIAFSQLLRRVHEIEGIERIRFTTSHPKDLSDDLIDCFRDMEKLCKHMHLPVQSGSSDMLRAMNRGYDRQQYLDKVRRLQEACPEIRLTTDVIVGFPGETQEDFEQTMSLVEEVRYADAFTFLYSPRPGTAAAELEESISPQQKQQRFERLVSLQQAVSDEIWNGDIGRQVSVLVEGESKVGQGQMFGRSTWNRIVNFTAPLDLVGKTVTVKVVKNFRNSQLGELID